MTFSQAMGGMGGDTYIEENNYDGDFDGGDFDGGE